MSDWRYRLAQNRATLLAFAPASQATRVPDTLPVSLPDVRTTDNSPAPDDTGVWPPMPRVPVIPIMGTGPGSTIETFDTPAGDPTAVPADPGRVSDPSIPGLPTVLASQADPVSVPEPTSALLLALPLGALLVASAAGVQPSKTLQRPTARLVRPPLRQRWQTSASARQQSCPTKHKLRACSTLPTDSVIVEQALSRGNTAALQPGRTCHNRG